jgi:hypothetical protein
LQSMDTFLSRRAWTNTLPLPRADDSPAADPQQVEELAEELATQDDVVLSDLKVARYTGHLNRPYPHVYSPGRGATLGHTRWCCGWRSGCAGCWSRLTRG